MPLYPALVYRRSSVFPNRKIYAGGLLPKPAYNLFRDSLGRPISFQYTLGHTRHGERLFLKELRVPVRIELMGTAQVFSIGYITPFGLVTLVDGYPFLIIKDFNPTLGVMNGGFFSDVSIRHTVIVLVG